MLGRLICPKYGLPKIWALPKITLTKSIEIVVILRHEFVSDGIYVILSVLGQQEFLRDPVNQLRPVRRTVAVSVILYHGGSELQVTGKTDEFTPG
jgi:hypothetical protein